MLLRESVQRCSACAEVTPHCRRIVALPKVFAVAAAIGAGGCFLQGREWWPAGGVLLVAAVFLLLRDRDKHWGIHCVRCRGKQLAKLRRTKPTLDGRTTIDIC